MVSIFTCFALLYSWVHVDLGGFSQLVLMQDDVVDKGCSREAEIVLHLVKLHSKQLVDIVVKALFDVSGRTPRF